MDLWLPRHAQKERQFARNDGMLTQMCLRQILNVRFAKGNSAAESLRVSCDEVDERHVEPLLRISEAKKVRPMEVHSPYPTAWG